MVVVVVATAEVKGAMAVGLKEDTAVVDKVDMEVVDKVAMAVAVRAATAAVDKVVMVADKEATAVVPVVVSLSFLPPKDSLTGPQTEAAKVVAAVMEASKAVSFSSSPSVQAMGF